MDPMGLSWKPRRRGSQQRLTAQTPGIEAAKWHQSLKTLNAAQCFYAPTRRIFSTTLITTKVLRTVYHHMVRLPRIISCCDPIWHPAHTGCGPLRSSQPHLGPGATVKTKQVTDVRSWVSHTSQGSRYGGRCTHMLYNGLLSRLITPARLSRSPDGTQTVLHGLPPHT